MLGIVSVQPEGKENSGPELCHSCIPLLSSKYCWRFQRKQALLVTPFSTSVPFPLIPWPIDPNSLESSIRLTHNNSLDGLLYPALDTCPATRQSMGIQSCCQLQIFLCLSHCHWEADLQLVTDAGMLQRPRWLTNDRQTEKMFPSIRLADNWNGDCTKRPQWVVVIGVVAGFWWIRVVTNDGCDCKSSI